MLTTGALDARAQVGPPSSETLETRQARELTLRARARFDAGDYAAALAEYTRAHELLAGDPRRADLLNNIAVCHERLFHYDLALQYYERYLHEAASDPADRAEVEAVIRGLRDLLGKLHITSNVRADVWIDERLVGTAPGDVMVPAGRRVVKLNARGRQGAQREIEIVARGTQTAHFELEAVPAEYHGIEPTYFWVGVGLTAGALVAGGALGLVALDKHRENERRARVTLPLDDEPKRRFALASDISFGAAALFAVGSGVLFFLSDFGRTRGREAQGSRAELRLVPDARSTGLSLQLDGAF